jgi:hypothetical protein
MSPVLAAALSQSNQPCHPEKAESRASERLPTKDLCTSPPPDHVESGWTDPGRAWLQPSWEDRKFDPGPARINILTTLALTER